MIKKISVKNIIITFVCIIIAQVLLVPVYFFGLVGAAFNDTGFKAKNISEFMPLLTPLIIVLLFVVVMYLVLNKLNCNKIIINLIYIPVNILLILLLLEGYIQSFTDIDLSILSSKEKEKCEIYLDVDFPATCIVFDIDKNN